MKSFTVVIMLLVGLTLFSFKNSGSGPNDQEKIVQRALAVNTVENKLKKGPDNEYLPVVLITNNLVTEDMHFTLVEQDIQLVSSIAEAHAMGNDYTFIELKELKINTTTAKLQFQLDDYKIKVTLKNEEDEWLYASSSSRKKGHFSIDADF